MNQTPTEKELYSYLIHDVEALQSTVHFKLVRLNDEIRRINKQPYIHKQVKCLEEFKIQRKDTDKLISKVGELLEESRLNKKSCIYLDLANNTETYKVLRKKYFELK